MSVTYDNVDKNREALGVGPQCRKTTVKGGAGVDDASGISTWRCVLDAGHEGDCKYLMFVRNGLEVRS